MHLRHSTSLLFLALWGLAGISTATAQVTTCKTGNCTVGKDGGGNPIRPSECQNVASPRVFEVLMDSATLRFIPSSLRIEGEGTPAGTPWDYQCIRWRKFGNAAVPWHSATEDTLGSSCNPATACSATNTTPPCDWETGNIDNNSMSTNLEYSVCHYKSVPPGTYSFRCRLHSGLGMTGGLTVVEPISLRVNKTGVGDASLEWAVGGVGPWNVWRDAAPGMPAPTNLTPPGTAARSLTDATIPATGDVLFYMVSERN